MKAFIICLLHVAAAARLFAQEYTVEPTGLGGGGGSATGGDFTMTSVLRAPVPPPMEGGGFSLTGDVTGVAFSPPAPEEEPVPIFDNTAGSENGGLGVTATTWLANKFAPGARSWRLHSVSLLLNSQDFSGAAGPPCRVDLRIYTNDPATGRPSADTGVVMELFERTNPVTLARGRELVKWTPAAPFTLQAHTGYWAVLSAEDGKRMGMIASFTRATGEAASLGATRSIDAGATWGAPDNESNRKMLVTGLPLPADEPAGAESAADTLTTIPGGSGPFTGFPAAPGLGGNNLAFFGTGADGQEGFYLSVMGSGVPPSLIANRNTPIPGGVGSFLSFGAEAGIIIVSGNTAIFGGAGAGGQKGIYASVFAPPQAGPPMRVADTATAIPGGAGNFTEFPHTPGLSGENAVFTGAGAGGQKGVYAAFFAPPQAGPPARVADRSTAIPGGAGVFTDFPSAPSVSGGNVVFAGNGADGQQGVYAAVFAPPQAGTPFRIADKSTAIPGGAGAFTDFGSEAGIIIVSGNTAVFGGGGSGGQKGIYASVFAPPQAGPPARVADKSTAIPGGAGNFTDFGEAAVSETDIAFLGRGGGGQEGIYDMTGGSLLKVAAVGDAIGGRRITGLKFARGGLYGDPVAFQSTFADGSQGVFRVAVLSPSYVFRITAAERSGDGDLTIGFASLTGEMYVVESSPDMEPGTWETVPGGPVAGDGGTLRVTVSDATAPPRGFYRVRQLP